MNNIQGTLIYSRQSAIRDKLIASKVGSKAHKRALYDLFRALIPRQRSAMRRVQMRPLPYEDAAYKNAYDTLIGFGLMTKIVWNMDLSHVAITPLGLKVWQATSVDEVTT